MVIEECWVKLQCMPKNREPRNLLPVLEINPLTQLLLYELKLGARTGTTNTHGWARARVLSELDCDAIEHASQVILTCPPDHLQV